MSTENYEKNVNYINFLERKVKIWKFKTSENDGSTILHLAVLNNNSKIIKEIIRYCKKNFCP